MAVFEQADDVAALEAGSVVFIEDGEIDPVETGQTFRCSAPEIAVTRLNNGADDALRQAAGFGEKMFDCKACAESTRSGY